MTVNWGQARDKTGLNFKLDRFQTRVYTRSESLEKGPLQAQQRSPPPSGGMSTGLCETLI